MPIPDFYECMKFDEIEPFGERRGDIQAGMIAATVATFAGKESKKAASPIDFMPLRDVWDQARVASRPDAELLHQQFLAFKGSYDRFREKNREPS
jgi:hypothetical protein